MKHLSRLVMLLLLTINLLSTILFVCSAYSSYIQPTEYPVWACLGLAFPLFLLLNACFLLLWLLIRRYKAALLSLFGALVCAIPIHTYIPINIEDELLPEMHIKLLSYNVMGFDNTKKVDGKNPMLTYLKESGADIICLQEYATLSSKNHLSENDVRQMLKGYRYQRSDKVGKKKGYTNRVACFSKYPILSAWELDCSSNRNGAVCYEIKVGNDTMTVINCHLESNKLTAEDREIYADMLKDPEKEKMRSGGRLLIGKLAEAAALRAIQADVIATEVAASRHPYVLVCGDFNDTPISYTHRVVDERLDDAFVQSGCGLGTSYNRNAFYFRIDHIFLTSNLRSFACTVDRSIKDSDHYPIWCYIAKRENKNE